MFYCDILPPPRGPDLSRSLCRGNDCYLTSSLFWSWKMHCSKLEALRMPHQRLEGLWSSYLSWLMVLLCHIFTSLFGTKGLFNGVMVAYGSSVCSLNSCTRYVTLIRPLGAPSFLFLFPSYLSLQVGLGFPLLFLAVLFGLNLSFPFSLAFRFSCFVMICLTFLSMSPSVWLGVKCHHRQRSVTYLWPTFLSGTDAVKLRMNISGVKKLWSFHLLRTGLPLKQLA